MMYKKHFITLVVFTCMASLFAAAQKNIHATWQHPEVVALNRQSFRNELHLSNRSAKSATLTLSVETSGQVFYSKKLPDTVLLAPGDRKTMLIEGIRLNAAAEPLIMRTVITYGDHDETTASFVLLAEKMPTPVKAVFDNQPRYFSSADDTIRVPVKMQNYSSRKQFFSYNIKDEAKGLEYELEGMNPWLEAYESKTFLLKIFRNDRFKDFLNYKMSVEMYDAQKTPVLQSFVPVQSISSYYRMNNPSDIGKGELLVEYRTLKDTYQVSDIRYADKIQMHNNALSFQLRHQYYFMQRNSQLVNSYLQWNGAWGMAKIGEIYTTGEFSAYGNGFYMKYGKSNIQQELWGILNTGLLYSSVPVFSRNKKTFGYTFTKTSGEKVNQFQLGYTDDTNTGGYGMLFHAKQYRRLPGGRIETGLAYSTEFSKLAPQSTISMAGELLYRQQLGKWQLETNARFTGKHYLGQGRGQNTVLAKVVRTLSSGKQISAGQYWQHSNPEYYINFSPRQYTYHRLFAEYAAIRPQFSQSLKLQYQEESLGDFYFTGASRLYSTILAYQASYLYKNEHLFTLSVETARQNLVNASGANRFTAFRLKTLWRHRNFSSRISWQNAVFTLNSHSAFRPDGYQQVEWLTQYRVALPNPKLSASIQYGLLKEDFYKGLRSRVVIDMSYHPSPFLTLNAGITKLANFFWQQPEYKIGIIYKPGRIKLSRTRNIRIRIFDDNNVNGVKDQDENWAAHTNLNVAGHGMKTDDNGLIRVHHIPKGEHFVSIKGIGRTISVTKNTELHIIPLEMQFKIGGKLVVQNDSSLHANRTLYFRQNGGTEFVTTTALNGSFSITLPKGEYFIAVTGLENAKPAGTKEKNMVISGEKLDVEIVAEPIARKINHEMLTMH